MPVATILRRGLLGLTGLGLVGTTIELVFLRHWSSTTAATVWIGVVTLAIGFVALLRRPSRTTLRIVRATAAVAFVIAITGIWFHVAENLTAGPLDRAYATTWDTMSAVAQWWTAITGGVGPAPTLAPGALAEISLGLLLATVGWRPAVRGA
jgi:hypothetical protein